MTLPPDRYSTMRTGLEAREAEGRLRVLREYVPVPGTPYVEHDGGRLLSFCSNDYLGLATDPDVVEGAVSAAKSHGGGSASSRLVSGSFGIHAELEAELADVTGREAALLFVSGFQANTGVIPALAGLGGVVLYDEMSHASIRRGCWLSRAEARSFRHNDPGDLDRMLALHPADAARASGHPVPPPVVVTESLFSMDGDRAPLAEICEVADRHGALLMVDDAHAFGVFGDRGEGLAAQHPRVDVVLGTFGKALGSSGAFVACDAVVKSHLVNFCAGVIYSTAPAPAVVGAARVALEAVRSGRLQQPALRALAASAHERLRAAGFDTAPSDTQIIPVRLGADHDAVACEAYLRARGILAVAIRPPTVPEGTARIRISLTRLHTAEHVELLVAALAEYRGREAA